MMIMKMMEDGSGRQLSRTQNN